jgi:hypothetical protein
MECACYFGILNAYIDWQDRRWRWAVSLVWKVLTFPLVTNRSIVPYQRNGDFSQGKERVRHEWL